MNCLALALAMSAPALAQQIELVEDIDSTASAFGSSDPTSPNFEQEWFLHDSFVELDGFWFFSATHPETGRELWRTDGSMAGTVMVADIHPNGDSNPKEFTKLGEYVYFMADDGVHGSELWRTDGSSAGTQLVADINPGPIETLAQNFVAFGNALVFNADGPNAGQQLWRTDGTASGTYRIKQLGPEPHAYPKWFTADGTGAQFYFTASPVYYKELLFVSDGTEAGTHQVMSGSVAPFEPIGFQNINGVTLFAAGNQGNALLWVTDGSPTGTRVLNDVNGQPVLNPKTLFAKVWNDKLYFGADDGPVSALWVSDGTSVGTHIVQSFQDPYGPHNLVELGGKLYFTAFQPLPIGRELHVFDGVSVQLVTNLTANKNTFKPLESDLVASGGWLAFKDGDGKRLFRSDGTAGGTQQIVAGTFDLSGIDWMTLLGGNYILFVATVDGYGRELFRSDLATGTVELLADIDPLVWTLSSGATALTRLSHDKLVFFAGDQIYGREPRVWTPNGGVELLADIDPGSGGSTWVNDMPRLFSGFVGDYGWLFFGAHSAGVPIELWKTNGLSANTKMVSPTDNALLNLGQAFGGSDGKRFYFVSTNGPFPGELYSTDGSSAGTGLAADIFPSGSSAPEIMGTTQRGVLVSARSAPNQFGLYLNSGDQASTQQLHLFDHVSLSNPVEYSVVVDERVYFQANTTPFGKELWVTDSTAAGTQMVVDLVPGNAGSNPRGLFEFDGRCLFFADNVNGESSLWSVDAGGSLTELSSGLAGNQAQGSPFAVARVDGFAYFAAASGASEGTELWRSDGTSIGTQLAADVVPGAASSFPRELVASNGGVYFTATSLEFGRELYFYDAATGVATLVEDLHPGPTGSEPKELVLVGGQLLFSADGPFVGRELYRLVDSGPYVVDLGMAVTGVELTATTPRLGTTLTFKARNVPAGTVSALLFSKPRALPGLFYTEFGQACWIEPGSLSILRVFTSSEWSYNIALPVLPALVGTAFHAQVYAAQGGFLPARTSNALGLWLDN